MENMSYNDNRLPIFIKKRRLPSFAKSSLVEVLLDSNFISRLLEIGGILTLFSSLQSSLHWNELFRRNYCTMNENFKSLGIEEVIMIRTQDIMQILPSSPEWLP
uniref:Uncharacterized protein n=1 Tax=Glossina pallidipes TaxID=7398 RepID=A0A1A9ZUV1_GLOPL